ncbi:MAG: SDR family oxidoreductase [Thauera propionica]|nr:SDR family oxidoreductase [Thauera propionica]
MTQAGWTLVTGGTGFIGSAVLERLKRDGISARGSVRNHKPPLGCFSTPALEAVTDWRPLLNGCDTIIHTAARVHVMQDAASDPLAAYREVNVLATLQLARQAVEIGVKRFVYLSSAKVNGESTLPGRPFRADDAPAPQDAYGISKAEAETALRQLATITGLEVVIIRPPLVYGPGVKANFLRLMQCLRRGLPLPLGAVTRNRRSLVALDNLVDLIVTSTTHRAAANQVLLASDGEDLSTAALIRRLAKAMGVSAHLFPVPVWALAAGARLFGKAAVVARLCDSLQVDSSGTCALLDWHPPITVDEGLRRTARGSRG